MLSQFFIIAVILKPVLDPNNISWFKEKTDNWGAELQEGETFIIAQWQRMRGLAKI